MVTCDQQEKAAFSPKVYGDFKYNLKDIYGNNFEKQNIIEKDVRRRQQKRKHKLEDVTLPQLLAPLLQDPVEL